MESNPLDFPKSFPTLKGNTLLLREMVEKDIPAWFERLSDPESSHLSGDPMPESQDICLEWLKGIRQMYQSQEGIRWAIEPLALGKSIGSIGLFDISATEKSGEIGTVIGREHWGRGYVTEAGREVLTFAFNTLGLEKIHADCLVDNHASKSVLEKLGFSQHSVIPNYRAIDTGFLPGLLYIAEHRK